MWITQKLSTGLSTYPHSYPQASTGYPQPVDNYPVDNYLSTEPVDNLHCFPVDKRYNPVDCGQPVDNFVNCLFGGFSPGKERCGPKICGNRCPKALG